MMNPELLRILTTITPEEQRTLDGASGGDNCFFTAALPQLYVDRSKVLRPGEQFALRPHPRFGETPNHRHDYIELMYMCQGKLTHIINDADVVMEAGDILIMNQNARHAIRPAARDDIAINLIILPEFLESTLPLLGKDNFLADFVFNLLRRKSPVSQYLHFRLGNNFQTGNVMDNIIFSFLHRQGDSIRINQTLMGLLFLYLLDNAKTLREDAPNNYEDIILNSVRQYIDENYKTALLAEIAASIRVPVPYLSRLIRKKSGSTFKEILQERRFEVARGMLINTPLSVSDIVLAVGYENNSYFHRRFREKYSMSPKEYRILHSLQHPLLAGK